MAISKLQTILQHPIKICAIYITPKTRTCWYLFRSCNHDHIVQYLDHYKSTRGDLCIVMEYMELGTMTQSVSKPDKNEYNLWRALWQLSSALAYLHGQHPPIMHRDIKPDNILGKYSHKDGTIVWKLADFGIAQLLNRKRLQQYYAQTFAGTEIYMAPEVLNDHVDMERRYGTPADIWSLGAVMYFRISESHLFESAAEVANWQGGRSPISR